MPCFYRYVSRQGRPDNAPIVVAISRNMAALRSVAVPPYLPRSPTEVAMTAQRAPSLRLSTPNPNHHSGHDEAAADRERSQKTGATPQPPFVLKGEYSWFTDLSCRYSREASPCRAGPPQCGRAWPNALAFRHAGGWFAHESE